jgi:hypothetical protein
MNRILQAAVAVCLVSTASAQDSASTQQTPTAESGWAAMKKCAAILEDDLRHACSDNALRDAGLLPDSETASSKDQQRFGLQRPAARAASSPTNASDAPTQPKSEDKLEVTLAAVKEGRDGKLVLTTTDGAIWKQVETQVVQPTPVQGGSMTITKAILGGFMCKPNKWTTFRCARTR